jgi:hypothetical protein
MAQEHGVAGGATVKQLKSAPSSISKKVKMKVLLQNLKKVGSWFQMWIRNNIGIILRVNIRYLTIEWQNDGLFFAFFLILFYE